MHLPLRRLRIHSCMPNGNATTPPWSFQLIKTNN
jgi:hypothetical protein